MDHRRGVAYASDESGHFEIYVQPYPVTGDKWVISTGGGVQPHWRADGKELFYLSSSLQMVAVDGTSSGAKFEPAVPHVLFATRAAQVTGVATPYRQFDVAKDGQPFLINETPPAAARAHEPLMVVVNWTSLLRR